MNRLVYIILLTVAGFSIASCGKKQANDPSKGQRGKNQLVVNAIIVKPSSFSQQVTVSGTISANEQVELKAESTGKLIEISFKEGDFVKQGQLLAKINDSEIQARLQKLILDEKLAADDETRKKRLLEINALSQQEYDIALNKLEGIHSDINLLYSLSNCQGDGLCFTGNLEKNGIHLSLTHSYRYYFAKSVTMIFTDEEGEEIEDERTEENFPCDD